MNFVKSDYNYAYFKVSSSAISTNKGLHIILICFEYFPIFCASLSSLTKLLQGQYSIKNGNATDKFNFNILSPLSQIRPVLIGSENCPGNACFYSLKQILFILVFLVLFVMLRFSLYKSLLNKTANIKKIIFSIYSCLINFYDLIFFRYFSIFVIDTFVNGFLNGFLSSRTPTSLIISILSFLSFMIYVYLLFNHLNTFLVWIQMSQNPCCEAKEKNNPYFFYPFDNIFSSSYESFFVLVKVIICLETSLLESLHITNKTGFLLNVLIIGLVIYKNISIVYNILILKNNLLFSFNKAMNSVRIIFLIFNLLTLASYPILLVDNSSITLFLGIILLLILFSTLLIIIYAIRTANSIYQGNNHTYNMVYLLNESKMTPERIRLILIRHSLYCANFEECKICHVLKENKQVDFASLFLVFYKTEKKNFRENQNKCHLDLFKLVSLHLQKNYFKLFNHIRRCLKIYQNRNNSLIINMIYLFDLFVMNATNVNDEKVFKGLVQSQILTKEIEKFLVTFQAFFIQDESLKDQEHFISIAKNLTSLSGRFFTLNKITETQEDRENIYFTQFKYNMLIERFLLESLFNKKFSKYKLLDIEQYEGCINTHFKSNKILQLSIQFSESAYNLRDYTRQNCSLLITTCGEDLIQYKNKKLEDLFPKIFQQEGLRRFIEKLNNYKNIENFHSRNALNENIFDFIILQNKSIEHFKYRFQILPFLFTNSIIVQGVYIIENDNLIIFKKSTNDPDNAKLLLHSFGEKITQIFFLEPFWIAVGEENRKQLWFDQIFQSETIREGKYILNYENYLKVYWQYVAAIKEELIIKLDTTITEINFLLERAKLFTNVKVDIKIHKLFDIISKDTTLSDSIYYVFTLSNYSKVIQILRKHESSSKQGLSSNTFENDDICNNSQSFQEAIPHKFLHTGTDYNGGAIFYLNDNKNSSVSSIYLQESNMSLVFSENNNAQKKKVESSRLLINRERFCLNKKFQAFTWIILGFNILITLVTIIFFIIQRSQDSNFTTLNRIFNDFKIMRNFFSHSVLSLLAISYVGDLNTPYGKNEFVAYSKIIGEIGSIPPKMDVFTFLFRELEQKIVFSKAKFDLFNQNLFHYNNPALVEIFLTQVEYLEIIKNTTIPEVISSMKYEITCKEFIQRFLNSFSVVINSKQNLEFNQVYIISMRGSNIVEFGNVYDKDVTSIQKELYSVIINYDLFFRMLQDCETALQTEFDRLKRNNELIPILFTITVCIMNCLLSFCCWWYITLVENQIKVLIYNMLCTIREKKFISYYPTKLGNLISLCRFYENNPVKLIHKIENEKKDFQANLASVNCNITIKANCSAVVTPADNNKITYRSNKKCHKQGLLTRNTKYAYIKLGICFGIYFMILIIFNLIISNLSFFVKIVLEYTEHNSEIENCLFSNLNFIQIMALTNRTDREIGTRFTGKSTSEEYVENKIGSAYKTINLISKLETSFPDKFRRIEDKINYTCNSMYRIINDSITVEVITKYKLNYFEMLPKLCNQLDITHLNNFEHLLNEMNFRTHRQLTRLDKRNYNSLAQFRKSFELFQLYLLIILVFRPIRVYMRNFLFMDETNIILSEYSLGIAIYFGFNILTEIIIFIIIHSAIIKKLKITIKDLVILDDCLQC